MVQGSEDWHVTLGVAKMLVVHHITQSGRQHQDVKMQEKELKRMKYRISAYGIFQVKMPFVIGSK